MLRKALAACSAGVGLLITISKRAVLRPYVPVITAVLASCEQHILGLRAIA